MVISYVILYFIIGETRMLNKRQNNIIELLNNYEKWMTGKEIAKVLNVSDRTIRSDIESINNHYNCSLVQSNKRLGYHLDENLLSRDNTEVKSVIPQTSKERCVYIIKELLFKSKEINLLSLQEQVFVSGYSIDNDLKKIRQMINSYPSLSLIRSKNYIRLEGSEYDKRQLYKRLLTEETKGNFINLNSIADLWNSFDLLKMKDILEEVCEKYNYQIHEMIFPMIMIHAGVAIERIIQHNYIKNQTTSEKLESSLEYQISYDFFTKVSAVIGVDLVIDEVVLFALLLMGKKSSDYRKDIIKENLGLDVEYLVEAIIDEVKECFDIDFSKDKDLKVGLMMHLQSLLERERNNVQVTNVYLQEIKRKYPLVFEIAICAGKVLAQKGQMEINENELAFLSLHLGAAYDRINTLNRYRAVMISPNNQMLSKMCCDKLNVRFEERMVIVQNYSFFEESMVKEEDPDLIITTVPLKHHLTIPTVQITLFVNYEDESKVFQALNLLDKHRYHDDFVLLIQELMREDLFYIKKKMDSSKKIIDFLCDGLIKKGLATKDYKKDVWKREILSATSFINGFAVPHSSEVSVKRSCISILLLDEPVIWGNFEVRLVILLAIKETDNHLLKIFFDWLSGTVNDADKFAQLLKTKQYQEFMDRVIM